jgi:GDP/UDP-N,N'-diacetylbacillosamine 2-epimerase (hydrolysing)
MPNGFEVHHCGDGGKVMSSNLWVSCSNRSEYGLVRPVLKELAASNDLNQKLSTTLVLYSSALDTCLADAERDFRGTCIDVVRWPDSKARKTETLNEHFGRLVAKFSRNDFYDSCDMLIVAGDRYESFAIEQAAFFQRIPIAHLFGGDISNGGHFDDHVRHAMSHLASIHFPVNRTAYSNLIAMHQEKSRIFLVGSPVVDELALLDGKSEGPGICDVLISFNPMTLQTANSVGRDLRLTLEALELLQTEIELRCLATYPNHEPGSDEITAIFGELQEKEWFSAVKSLGSPQYLFAIRGSKIVIGNSSSQVLEVPLLGQRCLLIGDRQKGRHKPAGVVHMSSVTDPHVLKDVILDMLRADAPEPCKDFGVAGVSRKIVELVAQLLDLPRDLLIQKNSPLPVVAKAFPI